MASETNPFSPPSALVTEHASLRRTISVVFLLILGTGSLFFGVLGGTIMLYARVTNRPNHTVTEMVACLVLYIGTGIALLIAGLSYRQYRDGQGKLGLAASILIPLVLFSIFGLN